MKFFELKNCARFPKLWHILRCLTLLLGIVFKWAASLLLPTPPLLHPFHLVLRCASMCLSVFLLSLAIEQSKTTSLFIIKWDGIWAEAQLVSFSAPYSIIGDHYLAAFSSCLALDRMYKKAFLHYWALRCSTKCFLFLWVVRASL